MGNTASPAQIRQPPGSGSSSLVLLVEDEPSIGALVRTYLERDGLLVRWATSAQEARAILAERDPALAVLDLGLPDGDGLEIVRSLRDHVPVLVLTARGAEDDRLAGFAAGADDYVVKPFSPREIVARVRALLRRAGREPAGLTLGALALDAAARETRVDGRPVELTLKEFDLLAHLVARAGRVVSREVLLEEVWGFVTPGQTRTVDQHVAQLRAKLGDASPIATVRGIGYKAVAP